MNGTVTLNYTRQNSFDDTGSTLGGVVSEMYNASL
jgi:hypothetical protein